MTLDIASSLVFILALIFSGEALAILAEVVGAKREAKRDRHLERVFGFMVVIITFGGAVSLGGYMLGIALVQNIWIISVASIASELVIEPFVDYALLKQLPTRGAALGFLLGASGMILALLVR